MTDVKTLPCRLRNLACHIGDEAAEEIEALVKGNERLHAGLSNIEFTVSKLSAIIDALPQNDVANENEKLREALEKILEVWPPHDGKDFEGVEAGHIARAALKREKSPDLSGGDIGGIHD